MATEELIWSPETNRKLAQSKTGAKDCMRSMGVVDLGLYPTILVKGLTSQDIGI